MHFSKSTIALVASLMATEAYGLPSALMKAPTCGTTPAGAGNQKPLSSPSADTATVCKQACAQDGSCKSFVFGLPPNASAPDCKLFGVEGAQVPKQDDDDNAMVFDIACSNVPTDKPTQDSPVGTMHKARGEPVPPPQEPQPPKDKGPQARGESAPPPPQEPQPPKGKGPQARGESAPPPPQEPQPPKDKGPKARGEPVPPPHEPQPPKGKGPEARGESAPPPPQEPQPLKGKGPKARGEPVPPPQEPQPPQGPKAGGEA